MCQAHNCCSAEDADRRALQEHDREACGILASAVSQARRADTEARGAVRRSEPTCPTRDNPAGAQVGQPLVEDAGAQGARREADAAPEPDPPEAVAADHADGGLGEDGAGVPGRGSRHGLRGGRSRRSAFLRGRGPERRDSFACPGRSTGESGLRALSRGPAGRSRRPPGRGGGPPRATPRAGRGPGRLRPTG